MSEGEEIVRIAARGDGMTASGAPVPMSAPGDIVMDDGALIAGPHRSAPPCRHFGRCGGCQLQHVDDEAYAGFLTGRIIDALGAHGIDAPPMRAALISPPFSRVRASLRAARLGKRTLLGFNEAASHRIVDIAECWILRPELFALVAPLRALLGPLLPRRGAATIELALADQGVDVSISGVEARGLAAVEALTEFARANGLARLSLDEGDGMLPRWEPAPVTVTLDDAGFAAPLPPGAFLQATDEGRRVLQMAVREAIGEARSVADLFAGLGTFTAILPPARVYAAEGRRETIAALGAAARVSGRPIEAQQRDLFRNPLPSVELARFDAVIIDPPRAGAKDQVERLAGSSVPRIAFVSCNPNTFSRDARMLVDGGYRIDWIQPVGQFRWSTHVELVAAFAR